MEEACFFKYDHVVRSESWEHDELAVSSQFFFVGYRDELSSKIEELQIDFDNKNIKVSSTKIIDGVLTPDQEIYSWERNGEESQDLDFWSS